MDAPKHIVGDFLQSKHSLSRIDFRKGSGLSIARRYTDLMDRFLLSLFLHAGFDKRAGEIPEGRLSVVALGSYGRRELCFGSDVDLLVIHKGRLSSDMDQMIGHMLYPLWDAKLDVAHSVLNVQECTRLMMSDFRFLTSVMDARFLFGSQVFFRLFQSALWSKIRREKKSILGQFMIYQQKRKEKYGSQSYFVEPDIKEGLGGLRDIHFMTWMARLYFNAQNLNQIRRFSLFSHFDVNRLNYSKSFLFKVRNCLHNLAGIKEDRLLLSHQRALSEILGYQDSTNITGAGRFMRHFYLHMNRIRFGHEEFKIKALDAIEPRPLERPSDELPSAFQILKGHIVLQKGHYLAEDPLLILNALNEANRRNFYIGSGLIWESRKRIALEGKEILELPGASALFLELIFAPGNRKVLRLALEIGVINLFIPEFRRVRNLAQFNYYHEETVDLHLLRTLEVIHNISNRDYDEKWQLFRKVFEDLEHPEWLYLAGLLHDIGKGYRGDHSLKGASLIPRILKRWGMDGEVTDLIVFLVKHHLLLTNVSQRRDLNEERTSVQVAQTAKTTQNLKMLFLLTVADSFATGPLAHSDWKILLLIELFLKAMHILERGTLASPDATKRLESNKRELRRHLKGPFRDRDISGIMDQVSTRYYLNTPLEDMIAHFRLALTMGDKKLAWHLKGMKNAPVTRVILCTYDQPGLFSKMVGVFTLKNIKVLSAKIFTLKNGLAFDIYEVTNPLDPLREEEMWKDVYADVL
ncbi:MAG: HD domain-containing protein, partial [Deltaproteobacteria bacterium]|nr:HD domain-containing protein [Deltaproteobacteria bacterium]